MYAAAHLLAVRRANAAAARMRDRGAPAAEVARVRATLRGAGLDAAYGAAPGKPPAEMRVADAPRPPPPLGAVAAATARAAGAAIAEETARILAREWIGRAEKARGRADKMNTLFNLNKPPTAETMEEMRAFDATALEADYAAISRGFLSVDLAGELDEERARLDAEAPNLQSALAKLSGWYDAEARYGEMQAAARKIAAAAEKLPPEYGFYIRGYFMESIQDAVTRYEEQRREIERIISEDIPENDRAAIEDKMDSRMENLGGKVTEIIKRYEKRADPVVNETVVRKLMGNLRSAVPGTPAKTDLETLREITGEQPTTKLRSNRYYFKLLAAYIRPDLYFENTDGAADAVREICTSTVQKTNLFKLTDSAFVAVFLAAMPYILSAPDAWDRARNFESADPAKIREEMTELLLLHWDPAQSHYADMSWMPASNLTSSGIPGILGIVRDSETLDDAVRKIYAFSIVE